ncbi:MAG: SoxY-related AACIE arm protein [Hyphomicrobiales bacterium]|nr:SoxY-related AACIE arm protein [Hyphomicrobiales bacterium]
MSVTPSPDERSAATRRAFLLGSATLTLCALTVRQAEATPASMRAAIRQVVGEAPVRKGRLKLDLPPLIENGNTVPLTITGESPMTAEDHIKAIHIFTEKNPQPNVVSIFLGPRAGKASISTRIRLADSQKVVGIAQMSDGSFWSEEVEIIVTLAACLEEP